MIDEWHLTIRKENGFKNELIISRGIEMHRFASALRNEILKGLPGTGIQWQMASSDRMKQNFPRSPGSDARIAAVLILLFPSKGSVYTVFMQRPDYEGAHGGQISFPGGKHEPSDISIADTALREAKEETGVNPQEIEIIGSLTPLYIPVSNMLVTPVAGWMNEKPVFRRCKKEVIFLFDADIRRFLDNSSVKSKPLEINDEIINIRYFDYDGNVIWGATAMIMYELLAIIKNSADLLGVLSG
jgi:8-oxo-dGTP pyrophosphatase MutT (NUDIX family)